MSNFPTPLEEVIHHNVIKNNKTGGPALDIGPMQLLWRALGENTGYTFSIFEMTVVPGMGIPLHRHPFAEFFYLLEGDLSIGYWNNQGVTEWDKCEAGESLMVQPNAPHSFFNNSDRPCRVLSVSTYHHERMMKDAVHPDGIPVWTYNQTTPIFTPADGQPTGSNVVSIYSVSRGFKTPYAQLFGLNVEQSLNKAWILNVGYVGTVSRHNLVLQDINQNALGGDQNPASVVGPNGATFSYQQSTRPYFQQFPNYGIINQINSAATSSYNALQVTLKNNAWHGLTSQFAYAWSHNLDDSSVFNTIPQNSLNLSADYGNANNDIRNHFSAYLNYAIPTLASGPKVLTRGWEVNGILKFQNGQPVNVLTGSDNSGTAEGEDRANIVGPALNSDRSVQGHSYAQYLNQSSFTVPANATYGNLGRNQVIGPGFGDVDLSLIKNTPIYKERVTAQFRVEMFNVLNRINLAQPLANLGYGSSFGASTSTIGVSYGAPGIGSGEPYNTQLALKIIF